MPFWRCPHCRTPQAESARCWVCRQSTTSCVACRHFRRGIVTGYGVCGIDPKRTVRRTTEMHGCWEAADSTGAAGLPVDAQLPVHALPAGHRAGGRPGRAFVPVGDDAGPAAGRAATPSAAVEPRPGGIPGGWWLWGDPEP